MCALALACVVYLLQSEVNWQRSTQLGTRLAQEDRVQVSGKGFSRAWKGCRSNRGSSQCSPLTLGAPRASFARSALPIGRAAETGTEVLARGPSLREQVGSGQKRSYLTASKQNSSLLAPEILPPRAPTLGCTTLRLLCPSKTVALRDRLPVGRLRRPRGLGDVLRRGAQLRLTTSLAAAETLHEGLRDLHRRLLLVGGLHPASGAAGAAGPGDLFKRQTCTGTPRISRARRGRGSRVYAPALKVRKSSSWSSSNDMMARALAVVELVWRTSSILNCASRCESQLLPSR